MSRPDDFATFFCTAGFVILHLFCLGLWMFSIWRTRLWFFYVFLAVELCAVGLSVVSLILYYNPPSIPRLLGRQLYAMFFYSFIWAQLLTGVAGVIGSIFLLRWLFAAYDREKSLG